MSEKGNERRSETGYAVLVAGVRISLCERSIIGRAPDCDVCIASDRRVSRRHARLTVCAHGVVVEDLGSKGGVFVDGQRVKDGRLLLGGERLRVGHTEIALLRPAEDRRTAELFDEKTVIPSSRAPADSGYFRSVDAAAHALASEVTHSRASNGE
jgi:pSer/pThr/pTyr-binding forkhead associated (FHA) protein